MKTAPELSIEINLAYLELGKLQMDYSASEIALFAAHPRQAAT